LHQYVVDAMVYQVRSDGVVNAGIERQLQLSPDAVSRSDQYRLRHIRKRPGEHSAKAADLGQCAFVERRACVFADLRHGLVGVVDRDAGIGV
jgi:hypothetical protein